MDGGSNFGWVAADIGFVDRENREFVGNLDQVQFSYFFLSILMVIISLELTRVNPDQNIFSINVELKSIFFFTLQRFGPSPPPNFISSNIRKNRIILYCASPFHFCEPSFTPSTPPHPSTPKNLYSPGEGRVLWFRSN